MERAPVLVWRLKSPSGSPAGVHEAEEEKKELKNFCRLSVKRRWKRNICANSALKSKFEWPPEGYICNALYLT